MASLSKAQIKLVATIATILAFAFAYGTNYIGYGGNMNTLAYITTIAFALSLVANVFNALKLTTQWSFWLVYNIVQLAKAGIQGNFANVGKYIFYILNSFGALFVWNDQESKFDKLITSSDNKGIKLYGLPKTGKKG